MNAPLFEWTVTPMQRKNFQDDFLRLTSGMSGTPFVTGAQAKDYFQQSQLNVTDLASIWVLSDRDNDRQLNEEEFMIAQFLVYARRSGVTLPPSVPEELVQSIRSGMVKSGSKKSVSDKSLNESPKKKKSKVEPPMASKGPKRASSSRGIEGSSRAVESAPNSTSKRPSGKNKWALSREEKKRFVETFSSHSTDGFVDGPRAVQLFTTSGLPREDLAKIWALSDIDRDTKLSTQEFCIAMHLITKRMQGEVLPDTVPTALVSSASSDLMKKSSHKNPTNCGSGLTRTTSQKATSQLGTRKSMMVETADSDHSGGNPVARSVSMAPNEGSPFNAEVASAFGTSDAGRNKMKVMSAYPPSHSTGELPAFDGGYVNTGLTPGMSPGSGMSPGLSLNGSAVYGSYMTGSRSSLALNTTLATLGVEDKLIPEFDASADLMKLEDLHDLPSVRALAQQLSDEVHKLQQNFEKLSFQSETLRDKISNKAEQNMLTQRRKQNFETILHNYNGQLEVDAQLYVSVKSELHELAAEIEDQQRQLHNPQFDLAPIRERKAKLQQEYQKTRAEFNAAKEDHMKLAVEVERLRAEGADAEGMIDTHWTDYGFKEEPVMSFGGGDDFTTSGEVPTFQFNPNDARNYSMDLPSGTMTPVIDDWDGQPEDSTVDEVNLNWLRSPDFVAVGQAPVQSPSTADFFQTESKEWANFSEADDIKRKRITTSKKEERAKKAAPKREESTKASKPTKEKEKEKKKHKK